MSTCQPNCGTQLPVQPRLGEKVVAAADRIRLVARDLYTAVPNCMPCNARAPRLQGHGTLALYHLHVETWNNAATQHAAEEQARVEVYTSAQGKKRRCT